MRKQDCEAQRKREFEELTAPLLGALYRVAAQKLRDARRAEDLVQEVCLKAYRAFDRFERGTKDRACLFRILSNTILDLQRQASKKPIEVDLDTGSSVLTSNIEAERTRLLDPEQQLMALRDNELDIVTNLEVLSHLEGCPSCQRELELDARLKALVREQLSSDVPPPERWGRVMQRVQRETEDERSSWSVFGRRWPRARLFQAAAAAVVALFALTFFFIAQRDGTGVLLEELVKDHLRSVAKESGPVDVPFTDPRQILAHFRAPVPPSLPVPLIIDEGTRLHRDGCISVGRGARTLSSGGIEACSTPLSGR